MIGGILILFIVLSSQCFNDRNKDVCVGIENGKLSYYNNFKYSEWIEVCKNSKEACVSMYKHMIYFTKICHDNNQTELKRIKNLYNKAMKEFWNVSKRKVK